MVNRSSRVNRSTTAVPGSGRSGIDGRVPEISFESQASEVKDRWAGEKEEENKKISRRRKECVTTDRVVF